MKVVVRKWRYEQREYKDLNRPFVAKGTEVYMVQHLGKFFTFAYQSKAMAEYIAEKFSGKIEQPEFTGRYFHANFRNYPSAVSSRVLP